MITKPRRLVVVAMIAMLTLLTASCSNSATGKSATGETGTGTHEPVVVGGISNAKAVAIGAATACALRSDGSVSCWGDNKEGQLGNGSTTSSATPVAVAGLSGVTAVSVTGSSACALLQDGSVKYTQRQPVL